MCAAAVHRSRKRKRNHRDRFHYQEGAAACTSRGGAQIVSAHRSTRDKTRRYRRRPSPQSRWDRERNTTALSRTCPSALSPGYVLSISRSDFASWILRYAISRFRLRASSSDLTQLLLLLLRLERPPSPSP